jgi:hypothetical protein
VLLSSSTGQIRASVLAPSTLGALSDRNAALSWVATSLSGGAVRTSATVARTHAPATGQANLATYLAIRFSMLRSPSYLYF